MVDNAVAAKLKDAKLLEVETTQAIVTRLTDWAKLFGFFLGIPLALLLGTLAILGIHTYTDFTGKVSEARKQALEPLAATSLEAKRIAEAYKNLGAQLRATETLSSQVSALSNKVSQIEQVVRFRPSASLTPELKHNLGNLLRDYYGYLHSVGFSLAAEPPSLAIDPSANTNSYYEPSKNQITVSPDLASTMAPLREYTHRVLTALKPDGIQADPTGIESGLADYFPSSFLKDSDFARDVWAVFKKVYPGMQLPSRDLNNRRSFTEIQPGRTEEHDAGTVWGGAFWEMRQRIGQTTADHLLLVSWKNLDLRKFNADMSEFVRELLKQDGVLENNSQSEQIRTILRGRGLKL
jgi:hypothetical protein